MKPKVALLTIGTEITQGQILNRNSAWLASELENLHYETSIHLSVPDDGPLIIEALNFCASKVDIIFTTGGLGPTSDDFTREVIGEWLEKELIFHEESWQQILQRMNQLGIKANPINRSQCYYPKGAQIITNEIGTANAFEVKNGSLRIICLPGPPREISHLFKTYFKETLGSGNKATQRTKLFRWHLLGKSEADLGVIVEDTLRGTSLTTGYRPHRPYVEIKVWCPEKDLTANKRYLDRLNTALEPWLKFKDEEDAVLLLFERAKGTKAINIIDHCSKGWLDNRLRGSHTQLGESKSKLNVFSLTTPVPLDLEVFPVNDSLSVKIGPMINDLEWPIEIRYNGTTETKVIKSPVSANRLGDAYLGELSLIHILDFLRNR